MNIKLYQEGDCFRNINPYANEPEKMVIEVRVKSFPGCYLVLDINQDGTSGCLSYMPHKEVHSWAYKKER